MANYIFVSDSGDAHRNLAADGWFLDNVNKGDIILYFYVNTRAVIIGRHQNAWRECRLADMKRDGVQLVRRHSGGGAVYHDEGNLNFSFIMHESDYDLDRQMKVIINAVRSAGLEPEISGRNDVLINGKKFSGNAYGLAKGNRSHHGTLLIDTDLSRLSDYLNVSAEKIRAKGISSVRSRVCNLSEYSEGLSVNAMRDLVIKCFKEEYGPAQDYVFTSSALEQIEKRTQMQRSWDWLFGKTPEFDYNASHRFSFGEMQFAFSLKEGRIRTAKIYSDCLNTSLVGVLEELFTGCVFDTPALVYALRSAPKGIGIDAEINEINAWLLENGPENAS